MKRRRVGSETSSRTAALLPIALGLSARVCEEVARYLMLRRVATGARDWQTGLMYGAGHGGVESMILGGLVLVGAVNSVMLTKVAPAAPAALETRKTRDEG